MARTVKRLYGPAQLPNTTGTRYTVPANTKARLTHIHVSNPTAGAVTFTLSIGADAAGTRLYDGKSLGAGEVADFFCAHVLDPAEIIAAHASAATSIVMVLNGEEFSP